MKAVRKCSSLMVGLVILEVLVVSSSVIETTTVLPPRRHYCGRGLTNALTLLCNGFYNTVQTLGDSKSDIPIQYFDIIISFESYDMIQALCICIFFQTQTSEDLLSQKSSIGFDKNFDLSIFLLVNSIDIGLYAHKLGYTTQKLFL